MNEGKPFWTKSYPAGVRPNLEYPEIPLPAILDQAAGEYPGRTATIFMGGKLTYSGLKDQVDRLARALADLGVKKGDRVGLMLPNIPQEVISYYAVLKIGAVGVGINPMYTERELSHQLRDSGAETLIFLDQLAPKVLKTAPDTPVRRLIATGIKDYLPFPKNLLYPIKARKAGQWAEIPAGSGVLNLKQIIAGAAPNPPKVDLKPEDLAVLQYTGGTTGLSKGAMLTHRNLVANVLQLTEWSKNEIEKGKEVIISVLPFFHSFGMTVCMNFGIYNAATLVLIPRFDLKMVLENIHKYRGTLFPGTPTIYVAVISSPELKNYNISSLKACLSGAAPLPLEVQLKFQELTGGKLVEGYGLSETSPVTHSNPFDARAEGSIGVPLPDTLCRIMDIETGEKEMPLGETGEICVKGPQVMKGYWNRPEENARVLRDGWFYTGDIGRMDERGMTFIVDRKKDLIIAGGYNIYPREVEEVLYEHPKIQEVSVAGVPDPYRGETVKAFIVLKEGETATDQEIISFCKERLAAYKVPKMVEFRSELPKTMVGKILRRVLVEEEINKQKGGGQQQN
ncbi:MAG: long-chain fatty acid--CoA ligase [Peptococcaceae bacterium]|nr:long-chain fatty acid--CoA ligase [Peptococcaceae bacterium]